VNAVPASQEVSAPQDVPDRKAVLASDDEPVLTVRGLTHRYGRLEACRDVSFDYGSIRALADVSFTVQPGEFATLVGANGAGKSTLYALLSGLFAPGAGQVSVAGIDLRRHPTRALARLGIVFQRSTLDGDLSVRRNLRYFADLQGIPSDVARVRIDDALRRHAIADVADRRADRLSGGQRRRVELARSLLHDPTVLLMDEATAGLDGPSRRDFVAHVRSLVDALGVSVLWATHLADEVRPSDVTHLLDRGRLLAAGPLAELLERHGANDIESLTTMLRADPAGGARRS